MSRQAYKFKLFAAGRNTRLDLQRRAAAQVWNHSIALHRRYYRRFGRHLGQARLKKRIAFLRNHLRPEWKKLGSQAVQDVIERIERGYQLFFAAGRCNSGRKVRPPTFKKTKNYRSFTLKQAGWKLLAPGRVRIGGCSYRYHDSRPVEGVVKTVTIGRDAVGDFWITFSVLHDRGAAKRVATGQTAGFDFGLQRFLTGSRGVDFEMPAFLRASLSALRQASRRLPRKVRGSKRRKRARLELARLHRQVADGRRDFQHKLARHLAQTYDVICIEDLSLVGMKALWGRKVSDLAFAEFVSILQHHCRKLGATLVQVGRFFASSKLCSTCGHIHSALALRDRRWSCPSCGTTHERDRNAAINIEREGLRILYDQAGHRLAEEAA